MMQEDIFPISYLGSFENLLVLRLPDGVVTGQTNDRFCDLQSLDTNYKSKILII